MSGGRIGTLATAVLHDVSHVARGGSGFRADVEPISDAATGGLSIDSVGGAGHDAGMTTPRRLLIDPDNACDYHLVSRCVQRAFLCGRDPDTGRDYSHRRRWLVDRLKLLARCFAIELYAYCIMSNHFHLVARFDPNACWRWSDEEVARRWVDAFPPTEKGKVQEERKPEARELLLGDPERLERARRTLGSLSSFMKHLKQPIARRANEESGTSGHLWDQRFYSGALLNEEALAAAMAYVDLNPVRAGIAERIEECRDTSIAERLKENSAEALEEYLAPLVSGLGEDEPALPHPTVTLGDYVGMVRGMADTVTARVRRRPGAAEWLARIAVLGKRQRAYGTKERLASWIRQRGLQLREVPLPT